MKGKGCADATFECRKVQSGVPMGCEGLKADQERRMREPNKGENTEQ